MAPEKFPTMSDFYDLLEEEFDLYDPKRKTSFPRKQFKKCAWGFTPCARARSPSILMGIPY